MSCFIVVPKFLVFLKIKKTALSAQELHNATLDSITRIIAQ